METADLQDRITVCMSQRRTLETIFDSVTDGILAVDRQLHLVNLNNAAEVITGWSREDAIGLPCSSVMRNLAGEERCLLAEALQHDQMLADQPLEIRRPDGEVRSLQITTHALQGPDGHSEGIVAIFRDLTEIQRLRTALRDSHQFERLVGKNHLMVEIYRLIEDIGDSDASVMILGESGTGKELVADAIHRRSYRREGPLVKVNCAALPEGLLESELFGHVKGAFTGAVKDKVGRFELADGGTLFLDEIGDISPDVQVKLLRVLQERAFERVGGTETRQVDVRVIAATHRDLRERMAEGLFREDLYYRLYVVPIEIPPLRDRKEDLPLLVDHFVSRFRSRTGKPISAVAPDALALMMDYDWPGNVRELENAIEHAFVKCHADTLGAEDLPLALVREVRGALVPRAAPGLSEKDRMRAALDQAGWTRSRAARSLGMHRTTVWRKMKEYGIEEPKT